MRLASLRGRARKCVLCMLVLVEPCFHLLGIPHPEGLSAQAMNVLLTTSDT